MSCVLFAFEGMIGRFCLGRGDVVHCCAFRFSVWVVGLPFAGCRFHLLRKSFHCSVDRISEEAEERSKRRCLSMSDEWNVVSMAKRS